MDVEQNEVFVFGSNLAGRHGRGSAAHARRYYGAQYGVGRGPTGKSYAIPTKDANLQTLSLAVIAEHVAEFVDYAAAHSSTRFRVVAIGCGLAGYKPEQIAPMFAGVTSNVILPHEFRPRDAG